MQAMSEIVDIFVPQTVEVVKVIPQEWVSERTVEQIVHVPVEIPRARLQQRTMELEHQLQLPWSMRRMKRPRNPPPSPRRRLTLTS